VKRIVAVPRIAEERPIFKDRDQSETIWFFEKTKLPDVLEPLGMSLNGGDSPRT
jgi:hypothetical protein